MAREGTQQDQIRALEVCHVMWCWMCDTWQAALFVLRPYGPSGDASPVRAAQDQMIDKLQHELDASRADHAEVTAKVAQ